MMYKSTPIKQILALFGLFLVLPVALATTTPADFKPLAAEPDQSEIVQEAIHKLNQYHYKHVKLDDAASDKILQRYIDLLDPLRLHFLASDIAKFKQYSDQLDDALKRGKLDAAFDIYNQFHQRRTERLQYVLAYFPDGIKKLDFKKDEHLETEREHAEWSTDTAAAQDLWRKFLKNDVLALKLSDKPMDEITSTLEKRYRDQLRVHQQTNSNDVFELFMSAYTHSYDPHTDYMPPRASENFDIHMSLKLEGIGALLQREEEYVKVAKLIPGGPADRSKSLQAADRITGVGQGKDGEIVDVIGWRLDDVVDLIRGPKGSTVRLNLIPASATDTTKTKLISIVRDTVKLEEESAKKKVIHLERDNVPYKVGVIELPAFYIDYNAARLGETDYRSSTRDVARLIKELEKEQIDGLIIDLRNNGGGSLDEANTLTGLFIKTGPVVQIRYPGGIHLLGDSEPDIAYKGPLAVLVNRLSASASEILAGAIQDHGRGIVIGSQTFGKGTVQNVDELDPGRLKFTQAKFYRISGDSTQARGVIPDIEFPVLLDKNEIGENSLPDALDWDRIAPVKYESMADLNGIIQRLQEQHEKRAASHPDFQYMEERIALMQEARNKTRISLNEEQRRKERLQSEQQLLEIENKRRKAKSMKLYKTFAELEAATEKEAIEEEEQTLHSDLPSESLLRETGDILLDWISLADASKRVAAH